MAAYTDDEIFQKVRNAMVDLFELEEDMITLDAHLFQNLGLDSIDAIDLVVRLKNETGMKVKPDEFKTVRTVNDIVSTVKGLLSEEDV